MKIARFAVICTIIPSVAVAEWCDPPNAPIPTTLELAQEYRAEFKREFENYFTDASAYVAYLDAERMRVLEEMQITAERYDRFLRDEADWE